MLETFFTERLFILRKAILPLIKYILILAHHVLASVPTTDQIKGFLESVLVPPTTDYIDNYIELGNAARNMGLIFWEPSNEIFLANSASLSQFRRQIFLDLISVGTAVYINTLCTDQTQKYT